MNEGLPATGFHEVDCGIQHVTTTPMSGVD